MRYECDFRTEMTDTIRGRDGRRNRQMENRCTRISHREHNSIESCLMQIIIVARVHYVYISPAEFDNFLKFQSLLKVYGNIVREVINNHVNICAQAELTQMLRSRAGVSGVD